MEHKKIQLASKQADGYVIPLGAINLVGVITDKGLVGCGAFNLAALDSFSCPVASVHRRDGRMILTVDDVLSGIVKEVNTTAARRGIKIGMSGKEALNLM